MDASPLTQTQRRTLQSEELEDAAALSEPVETIEGG
jgi:hypothetical protein